MDYTTEELAVQLKALDKISCELEPDMAERGQYMDKLSSFANDFIESLANQKAYQSFDSPSHLFKITGEKKSLKDILELYSKEVVQNGIKPASGGHIGYIPGGGIFGTAMADFIAAVTNEYSGMYYASPGAVNIENEILVWMKSIFGYPESAVGNLTSGGSIANLIALTSARDAHGIKGNKIERSVLYLSPQVHHCIQKSLRIIGLEDLNIRYVKLDDQFRILPQNLTEQILSDRKKGLEPFMVIASAGTTDTGAVDPLRQIGRIAKKYKLWYHVDAAYGGFFILSKDKKHLFEGIELSDSMVVDPHKSLFLSYGLGAVLIKNREAAFHSHHYTANYMQDALGTDMPINPADISPELSKHFRGLRLWIPLQLHGIKPFVAALEEKLLLTTYFRLKLAEMGFSLGPEPDLTVSYFWYPTTDIDENRFNKQLLAYMHEDGQVFFSSTIIQDRFVIRIAILAFRTKQYNIDQAIEMINRCLQKTKLDFVVFKNY